MHKRQRGKPFTAASQSQRLQQQVQATTTSMPGSSPGGGGEVRRSCKEKKSRSLCGREDGKPSAAAAQASRARAGSGGPQGQSWQQGKKEQRPSWSSTRKLGPRQHVLKDGRWPAQASFCPCSNFCPPSCGQAHAAWRGPVHVPRLGGRRGGTVPCEVARGG